MLLGFNQVNCTSVDSKNTVSCRNQNKKFDNWHPTEQGHPFLVDTGLFLEFTQKVYTLHGCIFRWIATISNKQLSSADQTNAWTWVTYFLQELCTILHDLRVVPFMYFLTASRGKHGKLLLDQRSRSSVSHANLLLLPGREKHLQNVVLAANFIGMSVRRSRDVCFVQGRFFAGSDFVSMSVALRETSSYRITQLPCLFWSEPLTTGEVIAIDAVFNPRHAEWRGCQRAHQVFCVLFLPVAYLRVWKATWWARAAEICSLGYLSASGGWFLQIRRHLRTEWSDVVKRLHVLLIFLVFLAVWFLRKAWRINTRFSLFWLTACVSKFQKWFASFFFRGGWPSEFLGCFNVSIFVACFIFIHPCLADFKAAVSIAQTVGGCDVELTTLKVVQWVAHAFQCLVQSKLFFPLSDGCDTLSHYVRSFQFVLVLRLLRALLGPFLCISSFWYVIDCWGRLPDEIW